MELLSWRFVAESGPAPVWLKLITSHGHFIALENHFYTIAPENVFKVVAAAVKGVGCDYNGVGTSFTGDAHGSDSPIAEDLVEVYNSKFGQTILLNKVVYYKVLMDYCCELKERNAGKVDETLMDSLEEAIYLLAQSGVRYKQKISFPKSWEPLSLERDDIFGGHENQFLVERFQINLKTGLSIQLGYRSFENLKELKRKIDTKSYGRIIKSGDYKLSVTNSYRSKEEHSLYYYKYALSEEEQYLAIVSFGEKQPTLYRFFVESIWQSI